MPQRKDIYAGSYLAVLEFPVRPVHLFAGAPHQVDGVRERRLDEAEAFGRRLLAAREIDDDGAPSGSGGQSGWRGCCQIRSICPKVGESLRYVVDVG